VKTGEEIKRIKRGPSWGAKCAVWDDGGALVQKYSIGCKKVCVSVRQCKALNIVTFKKVVKCKDHLFS